MSYQGTRGPAWTREICATCAEHNKYSRCELSQSFTAGGTQACEDWRDGDENDD